MNDGKKRVIEVLARVKEDIASHLDDLNLITSGILDSLDIMNLIIALEGEFDIEIDPEDVLSENFESVDAIVALVEKCRNA